VSAAAAAARRGSRYQMASNRLRYRFNDYRGLLNAANICDHNIGEQNEPYRIHIVCSRILNVPQPSQQPVYFRPPTVCRRAVRGSGKVCAWKDEYSAQTKRASNKAARGTMQAMNKPSVDREQRSRKPDSAARRQNAAHAAIRTLTKRSSSPPAVIPRRMPASVDVAGYA